MSTPPQHDDRHPDCGGMWIGGICTRCQKACGCFLCQPTGLDRMGYGGRVLERDDEGRITKFHLDYVTVPLDLPTVKLPEPTRIVDPEDLVPGSWSEYDDG